MYQSMISIFVVIFLLSAISTAVLNILFRFLGKRGYLGNLYPNVRGGTPRAIGIVPFIILSFLFLPGYNDLILIIGISALIDDIFGRRRLNFIDVEIGQLSRGIGMILVMLVGFYNGYGISSIFIALLIQPMNISDMQPGSACMVTIIMSFITIIMMLAIGTLPIDELPAIYTPLLVLVVCLAYCPLDFAGKIMLGEVGNHVFAVGLGVSFYLIGGLWWLILFSIFTICFIAFVRRSTLRVFFRHKMRLLDPTFGDYVMDVLTGGGLGDLIRKLILKDKQPEVRNELLISLGFRRLLFNPYASHPKAFSDTKSIPSLKSGD